MVKVTETTVSLAPTITPRKWSLDRIAVLLAAIAAVGTIFDAMLTYVGVYVYRVADELNPTLLFVAEYIGFGWTMVARAIFGLLLIAALYAMTRIVKEDSHRKLTVYGLGLASAMLTALAVYHIILYGVRVF